MTAHTTTIYLIRHAEAEGNIREVFQGHYDGQISEKGHLQLRALAERCKELPFDAVYASPLSRAYETAKAANRYHNLPIVTLDGLKEINGGVFEGNYWSELPTLFPEAYSLWQNSHHDFEVEGGESMRAVFARISGTIDGIAQKHAGQTVAVVSHGCAIRNYLCYAQGWPIERVSEVPWADNTAISRIEYDRGNRPRVVWMNDASHLSDENSTLAHQIWWRENTEDTK